MSTPEDLDPRPDLLHEAPALVLAELAESCGVSSDVAKYGRLLAQSEPPSEGADSRDLLEWVARVAGDQGMRATLTSAPIADIWALLRAGVPVVTLTKDRSGFVLLRRDRGDRVDRTIYTKVAPTSAREEPTSAKQLSRELEIPLDEAVYWILADPEAPNAAAVSSAEAGEVLTPWKRLLRILHPDRKDVLAVTVFAVVIGILSLATPIAVQALVNSIALGGLIQPVVIVSLMLFLALGFAAGLSATQAWIVEILQRRIFVRTVADLAARLPRVRLEAYDNESGRELVNRFFDVVTIQKTAAKLLLDTLSIFLAVLVGLTVLAFYHPFLLAFDAVLLIAIGWIVFGPLKRGTKTAIKESSAKYAMEAWLEEIADNPLLFKTGGAQQWVFERVDALSRDYVEKRATHFRVLFGQVIGAVTLQVLASTALLGIGGALVIQGSLTLGQLVAAELIVTTIVVSVAKMGKQLESFYDMMAAVAKVGVLLDLPVEKRGGERIAKSKRPAALEVTSLELMGATGGKVSFVVGPGEIVGVSGTDDHGRTRLVEALWRLRRPKSGTIVIDGADVRELSLESYRRQVAITSSDEMVTGTVRANIKLQRAFVSNVDVRAALEMVGLYETINRLPQGLDTVIHEKSPLLTSSEIQRLLLARALAGSPRLLVVDGTLDRIAPKQREAVLSRLMESGGARSLILLTDLDEVLNRCDSTTYLDRRPQAVS